MRAIRTRRRARLFNRKLSRLAFVMTAALGGCGDSDECTPMSCGDRAVVTITSATGQLLAGSEMLITVRAKGLGEIVSAARCPLALPIDGEYDRRGANYLGVTARGGTLERVEVIVSPPSAAIVDITVGSTHGEVDLSTRSAAVTSTCGCADSTFAVALK